MQRYFLAAIASPFLVATLAAQSATLYASDVSRDETGTINRDTAAYTPIGQQTTPSGAFALTGCAWDSNNDVLYAVNPGERRLYTLNTTTGAATPIGSSGAFGSNSNSNGLAYDPNSDTLYCADLNTNSLFTVDVNTSAASNIAVITGANSIEGLAYDPVNDILYGLSDSGSETVYRIDVNTAVATALPNPIGTSGIWRGLTYDAERQVLYGSIVSSGGGTLWRIDTQTGLGTLVGTTTNFAQGLAMDAPFSVGPRLQVLNLTGGQTATWEASNVGPGNRVIFAVSLTGAGPTTVKGVTVDMSPPILQLGQATANGAGVAQLAVNIPNKASGRRIFTQAAELAGGSKNLTNSLDPVVN